jgi:putative Mn2+ efflux pump MntP
MKGKIMTEINKRTVTKFVVKSVVTVAVGSMITTTLSTRIPVSERFSVAEITGSVGGWMVANKLQPQTDKLVDDFYDKREAKAKAKINN